MIKTTDRCKTTMFWCCGWFGLGGGASMDQCISRMLSQIDIRGVWGPCWHFQYHFITHTFCTAQITGITFFVIKIFLESLIWTTGFGQWWGEKTNPDWEFIKSSTWKVFLFPKLQNHKSNVWKKVHYVKMNTSQVAKSAELAISSGGQVRVMDFMLSKVLKVVDSFAQDLVRKKHLRQISSLMHV